MYLRGLPVYFQIGIVISIFSLVTSVLVLKSYYMFPKLQSPDNTLIMWLAFSTVLVNLSLIIFKSPIDGSTECYIQYFMQQIFTTANPLCMALFTRHISSLFTNVVVERNSLKLTWRSYLFVWGISFVSSIPPMLTNSVGLLFDKDKESFCWIRYKTRIDVIWVFILYYLPLYATIVYIFFLYLYILMKMNGKLISYFLHCNFIIDWFI